MSDEESNLMRDLEVAHARVVRAVDALRSLVAYVHRVGGFMTHADQQILHRAVAVLEESSP